MAKGEVVIIEHKLKSLSLDIDTKVLHISPMMVDEILISREYVHGQYAQIDVIFNVSFGVYDEIMHHKGKMMCNIVISEDVIRDQDRSKKEAGYELINANLYGFVNTVIPTMSPALMDEAKRTDDVSVVHNTGKANTKKLAITLIDLDRIDTHGITTGGIISGSGLDLIKYLLEENKLTNVIMSRFDNVPQLKKTIVPTLNTVDMMRFLQESFGIYDNDFYYFTDFNNTYILKIGKSNASLSDDMDYVFTVGSNEEVRSSDIIFNDKMVTKHLSYGDISFKHHVVADKLNYTNIATYTTKSQAIKLKDSGVPKLKDRLLHANYDISTYTKQLMSPHLERMTDLTLKIDSLPVYMLRPHKELTVNIGLNSPINGKYMMRSLHVRLIRDNVDLFKSYTTISGYRVEEI